ncbi:MAG: hypothetical protein IIB73_08855 [Proteobacteria bacterium]|nr:hypothetical protein [Pseudomonadota bacterium]
MDNPLSDADTLKIDPSGCVSQIGGQPASYDDIDALYIGLTKVSAALAPHIVTIYKQLQRHHDSDLSALQGMYMTDFLQHLIDHGQRVRAVFVDKGWLEIDSISDLELYSTLLDDGRLNRFCRISELC